jgi:hypothetical protein
VDGVRAEPAAVALFRSACGLTKHEIEVGTAPRTTYAPV